jgi:AraC-like DNA-binding protein
MARSPIWDVRYSLLFGLPDQADRLFADHATLAAIGVHVAQTYGGLRPISRPVRGGLALWQVRRAKELLSANLDGASTLEEIAQECRLSVSHFSRGFRQTVGVAPHKWLQSFRIDSAKNLLRKQEKTLSDVALACGFADQSHFPRAVGPASRLWRRHGDALAAAHFPVSGRQTSSPPKRGSPMSVPGQKAKSAEMSSMSV